MSDHLLLELASVVVLGIAAQWLAWRLKLPSILVLLIVGFVAGPITGILHPDDLLGDLLFPVVSVSVGVILFEGGLSLKFSDLGSIGSVVRNLVTIGTVVTWVLATAAAFFILGLQFEVAVLLGAILVVTGPTVITPLLRYVRPKGELGAILRWEGILIDPIGATLALLVFEVILTTSAAEAATTALLIVVQTVLIGIVLGFLGARLLIELLRRFLIPDYLQNAVTLMAVVGIFAVSNFLQPEAGLLTVTVMGIVMANQRAVTVKHIVEFKEDLGVMLIASLFILLSARLQLEDLSDLGWETIVFLVLLLVVVRPLAVFLSTVGSDFTWRQRMFMAWMAPRGIVAASVAAIFTLELHEVGFEQADILVPIVFAVIVTTVSIYGLTALPFARWLKVSQSNPQGLLIVGAHDWSRAIAHAVQALGFRVLLVDTNYANIHKARMDDLPTHFGDILSESSEEELDLDGIGRLLALTSNDSVNSLAALHFTEFFGSDQVYQLSQQSKDIRDSEIPGYLRGRRLFGTDATFRYVDELFDKGATVRTTQLTREFDYAAFRAQHQNKVIPLFLVEPATQNLLVFTTDRQLNPQPGQTIINLVIPEGVIAVPNQSKTATVAHELAGEA